jgi:hypothetical protein
MSVKETRIKPRAIIAGCLLLLAILLVMQWPLAIRFRISAFNYWFVAALAIAIPFSGAWLSLGFRRRWLKIIGVVGSFLALLPATTFAVLAAISAPAIFEHDASLELISEAQFNHSYYRLYRTNCGATCAFGLELRREVDTPLGIKAIWPLWSRYRADDGAVMINQAGELQIRANEFVYFATKLKN